MFSSRDINEFFGSKITETTDRLQVSIDSRNVDSNTVFFGVKGTVDGTKYVKSALGNGAFCAVSNPREEVDAKGIEVENSTLALRDFAGFVRRKKEYKVITITGSAGKTTTKDMVYEVLAHFESSDRNKKSFNNEFGVPLTILNAKDNIENLIVEIGADHVGEINGMIPTIHPDIAVVTNAGYAHIGLFGSKENIVKGKLEIANSMKENGILIVNGDNEMLRKEAEKKAKEKKIQLLTFGIEKQNTVYCKEVRVKEDKTYGTICYKEKEYEMEIPLIGEHFIYTMMLCVLLADLRAYDIKETMKLMKTFKATSGRFAMMKVSKDVTVIDDTYNSSPDAMMNAMRSMKYFEADTKVAFLGEMKELGDYSRSCHEMVGELASKHADEIICIAGDTKYIASKSKAKGMKEECAIYIEDIEDAYQKVEDIKKKSGKKLILVKGGRFAHMERISLMLQNVNVTCKKNHCELYINCKNCEEL